MACRAGVLDAPIRSVAAENSGGPGIRQLADGEVCIQDSAECCREVLLAQDQVHVRKRRTERLYAQPWAARRECTVELQSAHCDNSFDVLEGGWDEPHPSTACSVLHVRTLWSDKVDDLRALRWY